MRFAVLLALLISVPAWGQSAAGAHDSSTPPQPPVKATPGPDAVDHSAHGAPATPATKARPARDMGQWMTITGEVMDPACFLEAGEKSIGEGHYQCALDCAKSGQTLAIYARDLDRIYFIAGELPGKNPNEPLLPYIHKKVDVTGKVFTKAGVYGIVINKVALHQEKAVPPAK